jgi:hypothetical protein
MRVSSGHADDAVRHASATLVEDDETAECRESVKEPRHRWVFPVQLEMVCGVRDEDEVARAATADHLVRDVHVAALRVPGFREH